MQRRAVVRGRGHPHIRASHAKTLEFTGEPAVTSRATCVAAVAAELDREALALLRGRVVLTLTAGGREVSGEALINPGHRVADRLVIRRSYHADGDTLAVGSTLAADDLGPELAAALAQTATAVTLTITEAGPPPPLLIIRWAGQPDPAGRLGVLWRHAGETGDLANARGCDDTLRALREGGTVAATLPGRPGALTPAVAGWLAAAAGRGDADGTAAAGRGDARGTAGAGGDGLRFAVAGSQYWPVEALLAAGLPVTPALWLGRLDRPAIRREETLRLLRDTRVPAVVCAPAGEAAAALDRLAAFVPQRPVAVSDGVLDVGTAMTWTTATAAAAAARENAAKDVTVVTAAGPADHEWADLDAVARALADAGVAPRTLSDALRPFGLSRRRLYAMLGGIAGRPGDEPSAAGRSDSGRRR